MSDTKIKWEKQIGWPSRYVASIEGNRYEVTQKPGDGTRRGVTTWTAWHGALGTSQVRIETVGKLAGAKFVCERHAKGAAT